MSHATNTHADAPAVEPTTEALSTDYAQPELPERKAEFARRMEAEGTAKEADEFRFSVLERLKKKKLGTQLPRDLAWAAAMNKFPPADVAVDVAEDRNEQGTFTAVESDETDRDHFAEALIRDELLALGKQCEGQKVDFTRDIEFAYGMMNRPKGSITPKDCPSPGAWNQLQVVYEIGPSKYIVDVVSKVLLTGEEEKNKQREIWETDSETQEERLEHLIKALGLPKSSEIPDVDIEARKHG